MRALATTFLLCAAAFGVAACVGNGQVEEQPTVGDTAANESPESSRPVERDWAPEVLAAIDGYLGWERVADFPKWAPTMCAIPQANLPFYSDADAGPHSRKLYYLYVKDAESYTDAKAIQPDGQVLVKQGFQPVEAGQDRRRRMQYRCGEQAELFIMLKTTHKEGTDAGWVYAITTPDGSKVTHAGRIESCMRCHEAAGESRMFGVAADLMDEGDKPAILGGPPK